MKKLFAFVLLFAALAVSGTVIADEVNPVAVEEVNEFLTADQIKTNKILLKVGKLSYTEPEENNPAPEVTEADKKTGFIPFKRNYINLINYNTNPLKSEMYPSVIEAVATPGEREPLTLGLYPLGKTTVKFEVPDLISKEGGKIGKESMDLRSVRYLVKKVSGGIVRITPEMLMKESPVKLYNGVTRQLWITLKTKENTPAGIYEGDLKLQAEGKEAYKVKLRVEILPFKLIRDKEAAFGWFGNPDSGADLAAYIEHGFSWLGSSMRYGFEYKGGKVKLDFTALERNYEIIKKNGWEQQEMWISNYFPFYELTMTNKIQYLSPEFNSAYKDAIAQVMDWGKKKGLKIVISNHDEPREMEEYRNLANTIKMAKLTKEVPGVRIAMNNQDAYGSTDYLSLVDFHDVLYPNMTTLAAKTVEKTKRLKKTLWFYNSGIDRISFGFMTWKHGAKQRIEWAWQSSWNEKTSKDMDSFTSGAGGDPSCGAAHYWKGEVLSTPYLEWTSEGVDDYQYAYTLEQYIKKAEASKDPAAVKQAGLSKAVLEGIRAKIPATTSADGNLSYTISDMSGMNNVIDGWRQAIVKEIVKLNKYTEK